MKTKLPTLIAAVCLLIVAVTAQAAETSRIAKIEDTSGVKTDVTKFWCAVPTGDRFSGVNNCIRIDISRGYWVAIPFSCLISITNSGNKAEVMYYWRGQQRTISGHLRGTFGGESDFGSLSLDSSKLRQLAFSAPPLEKLGLRPGNLASVVLTNGTTITFSDINRCARYFSTEGYMSGGTMVTETYIDFQFMRGESSATLKFATIRKLEFSAGDTDTVTVTLRNGNTTSGKLSNEKDARVDGWTGETEQGIVFLDPGWVRSVEFGDASSTNE
jgi:hypothetical protein